MIPDQVRDDEVLRFGYGKTMPAIPAWPPKSAPRLFVADKLAQGATVTIEGNQGHYLLRVMRVSAGDTVILCDDMTGEWATSVIEAGKRDVSLTIERQLRPREDVPDFTLCAALLKKDRFDMVLEKACELGAARIQPVLTRRCVADRLNMERARAVVTEAAEQCARTALPELAEPVKLEALLRDWPDTRTLFFADESGGEAVSVAFAKWRESVRRQGPETSDGKIDDGPRLRGDSGKAALLVGPEGGFDDAERALIRTHPQARAISLGPRILRGETAAIAAMAVWMACAGDWTG